jgi:hypothetical protein
MMTKLMLVMVLAQKSKVFTGPTTKSNPNVPCSP